MEKRGLASPLFCCLDAAMCRFAVFFCLEFLAMFSVAPAWSGLRAVDESPFVLGIAGTLDAASIKGCRELSAWSLRGDIPWNKLESPDGRLIIPLSITRSVGMTLDRQVSPVGLLAYGHLRHGEGGYPVDPESRAAYVRYADFAVQGIADMPVWEVWNEWNLAIGMPPGTAPGKPEDYVRLLTDVYSSLKGRFPNKIFLGGAVAGIGLTNDWTELACRAGLLEHLDGFSFHPYFYWMIGDERVPERGLLGLVSKLEVLLAKYPRGKEIPLYVTELGWPTCEGSEGVTLDEQANWLARSLLLLRADTRIRGVWIYTLRDAQGDILDRESNFGLLFFDGTPKPAWYSYRDTSEILRNAADVERFRFDAEGYENDLAGVKVKGRDGRVSLALWTIHNTDIYRVVFKVRAAARTTCSTSLVGGGAGPDISIWHVGRSGMITVTVTNRPIVIKDMDVQSLEDVEFISGK